MIQTYQYELWNGKEVVGHYCTQYKLYGRFLVVPTMSLLKQPYRSKCEEILFPITYRIVSDNGVERLTRIVLDVRRKSKRQIDILTGRRSWL